MTDTPFMRNFVETAGKFESIFMPYAARRRKQSNGRFVHYTSAESGIKIIETKQLWMRSTTCMNDYREVQHGFDILKNVLSKPANITLFESTLDGCVSGPVGVGREAMSYFNREWPNVLFQTYIACVSEHYDHEDAHGRLSMWRAFGRDARVALVFRFPFTLWTTLPLKIIFSPVAYLREHELEEELMLAIESIRADQQFLRGYGRSIIVSMAFTTLIAAVVSLKHEGFAEEREWRGIYMPSRMPSHLVPSEVVTHGGVPQTIYKLPLDKTISPEIAPLDIANTLDGVIIGPTQYPEAMKKAFISKLESAGILDAQNRVVVSGIPIRT
jgi:hypothetical protein